MKNKTALPIITFICCFFLIVQYGCSKKNTNSDVVKSLEKSKEILRKAGKLPKKDLKGIPFSIFWAAVQKEGKKWAGGPYYIIGIKTSRSFQFDGHDGLSAEWSAKLFKPEKMSKSTYGRGTAKIVLMSERKGKMIYDDGRGSFAHYGSVIDSKDIKIDPKKAEQIANRYKNYKPNGNEYYKYELTRKGKEKNIPVWMVAKNPSLKTVLEKKEKSSSCWHVYVDARTGEVVQ